MYNVSSEYMEAIRNPSSKYYLRIWIDGMLYDGSIVVGGSFVITNQCADTDIVQIGSVYSAKLSCTIKHGIIERNTWEGSVIEASEGLEIDGAFEYVPLGVFKVAEANHTEDGVQITAYDAMLDLDKSFNLSTTIGTAYSILALMCQDCGVTLGTTEQEMASFPNGTQTISLYSDNDCETYRDVVYWIAQTVGCFATIGRDGKLYLKQYADGRLTETDTIDEYHRFEGGSFSDFVTEYSGVGYTDIESQEYKYVTDGQGDNKLTYNLGANPFLQYGTESTRKQMALNILGALRKIAYTPFVSEYLNTPAYDLGDIIVNEGGIGAGAVGCIMYYEYNYSKGYAVEGYGQNPLLATARNKVDKEISGIMSKTDKNSIQFYTFKNADRIEVGDERTEQLINIRFATAESKQVCFQAEVLCDADVTAEDIKAQITYLLDGSEITDYKPIETWSEDGKHIISLYYMIDVEPNTLYQWQVMLKSSGGSIVIPVENARGTIWGQGLVASDKWNGFIDVEDRIGAIPLDSIIVATFTEQASVSAQEPIARAIADTITGLMLDDISVAQFEDYVLMDKTSIYLEGMTWQDVYASTWGAIYDEHTW